MEKRSNATRLSLGIPCKIRKFNKRGGNWCYSEGLIRKILRGYLLLETDQELELDESIRIKLMIRRYYGFENCHVNPLSLSGVDNKYIEATVIRRGNPTINEEPSYGVRISNQSFKRGFHKRSTIVEQRKEERREAERRITDREIVELIELASEMGMDNVVFRSGHYVPKSTRQRQSDRRELLDRRLSVIEKADCNTLPRDKR